MASILSLMVSVFSFSPLIVIDQNNAQIDLFRPNYQVSTLESFSGLANDIQNFDPIFIATAKYTQGILAIRAASQFGKILVNISDKVYLYRDILKFELDNRFLAKGLQSLLNHYGFDQRFVLIVDSHIFNERVYQDTILHYEDTDSTILSLKLSKDYLQEQFDYMA